MTAARVGGSRRSMIRVLPEMTWKGPQNRMCCKNSLGPREFLGADSSYCYTEKLVDDAVLGEDIPLGAPLKLALAEHVHGFISLDGPLRRGKCPKPQPRAGGRALNPGGVLEGIVNLLRGLSSFCLSYNTRCLVPPAHFTPPISVSTSGGSA
jgi:hypothetical protein